MRRAAVSFCARGVVPEARAGSLVLSQQLARGVRPLISRASLTTASALRGTAINSRKSGLLSARSGRFFSTQASARLSNSRTTTPLLLANPCGIRFGTATKNAVRTYRVEGRPSRTYGNTLADAASGDKAAWLLIGGIAALGLGGIAVAGYLNQPVHTSAVPAYGLADLTAQRLRATYGYVVSGLIATGATAAILFRVGAAHRVLVMNPWLFLGASVLGTVGSLMAMQALPPERTVARHLAWLLFNACNGLALSPVALLGGAVVSKALVATGAVVGSLSLVAAAAPSESFLWMGGGLGVGLGVLIAASMGQMFFPASAFLGGITLYGGLGLFGLMMLYDTQRVMQNAKTREYYDPMNESIKVYLNTINIFVRMATIMANSQNNRRR